MAVEAEVRGGGGRRTLFSEESGGIYMSVLSNITLHFQSFFPKADKLGI